MNPEKYGGHWDLVSCGPRPVVIAFVRFPVNPLIVTALTRPFEK